MNAILGTMILVALAASASVALYAWFPPDPALAPAALPSLAPREGACGFELLFVTAPAFDWSDLSILVEGADSWRVEAGGMIAEDEPWLGRALPEPRAIAATDRIRIVHAGEAPALATLVHEPSQSVLTIAPLPKTREPLPPSCAPAAQAP